MQSDEPRMTEERTEAIRQLLAQHIREEPELRRRRLRRRALVWGGVGLVLAGGLTTGAAVLFGSSPVTNTTIVHCLSSPTRNADGSLPGSSASISDGAGPGAVRDALALCTEMWRQGVLSDGVNPTSPTQHPGVVPPVLQVCVLKDGSAAVVPSESGTVCQSLGLARPES